MFSYPTFALAQRICVIWSCRSDLITGGNGSIVLMSVSVHSLSIAIRMLNPAARKKGNRNVKGDINVRDKRVGHLDEIWYRKYNKQLIRPLTIY